MTLDAGFKTKDFRLWLTRDADFTWSLLRKDGQDWPVGTAAEIRIGHKAPFTVWSASVVGPRLIWNVDFTEVNTEIDKSPKLARLFYVGPAGDGVPLCWATGPVVFR